jgi:hypothetical protein
MTKIFVLLKVELYVENFSWLLLYRTLYVSNRWRPPCLLVVRVPGDESIGLGFDSRHNQSFWVVLVLKQGPLSLMRMIEELLDCKGREQWGPVALTTQHYTHKRWD